MSAQSNYFRAIGIPHEVIDDLELDIETYNEYSEDDYMEDFNTFLDDLEEDEEFWDVEENY